MSYKDMSNTDLKLRKSECEKVLQPDSLLSEPPTGIVRKLLKQEIKLINKELQRRRQSYNKFI